MKPPPFDYIRVESAEEAVALLAEHGEEARILAGGQSLVAMLNTRVAEPSVIVDISRADELDYVRADDGQVEIGAAATQAKLERWADLPRRLPVVAHAMPHVGHFQTRNRGTVCGSIAHADPSSELPLCLAMLGGEVVLESRKGRRSVAGREFQLGVLTTARRDDELVQAVRLPSARPGEGFAFREMAIRHGDFAIIAVAVRTTTDSIAIGVAGAADRPAVRDWPALSGDALEDALNGLAWEIGCRDDSHATAVYRRHLIRHLGRQAIEEARRWND